MPDWFDELDLDPGSSWLRMGTRALGRRPWLIADEYNAEERAQRAELLATRRSAVFVTPPQDVGEEVRAMVEVEVAVDDEADSEPLAVTGLAVQEDLCLLQRRDGAWHLDAAMLCFPSRWRLADKIGRPLVDVHEPTSGYEEHLSSKVDRLLDRLTDRPVLRRNWFVHPDASLHQPTAPPVDRVVPAEAVLTDLHLRSERQTLRKLDCGWLLFTIRIQHARLADALDSEERHRRFVRYISEAPRADLEHRGMAPAQVDELCRAWGIPTRDRKSDTTSDL